GLLTAAANDSFTKRNDEIRQSGTEMVLLDRTLAHYGPETKNIRDGLRRALSAKMAAIWPEEAGPGAAPVAEAPDAPPPGEIIEDAIRNLAPGTDAQRALQARALDLAGNVIQSRWAFYASASDAIPAPFLVALVVWISVIFASFGMFAPRNPTVVVLLLASAASISYAIFLILEMTHPF